MVYIFSTNYIGIDLVHHEIFRAKVGKGGIKLCRTRATYTLGCLIVVDYMSEASPE